MTTASTTVRALTLPAVQRHFEKLTRRAAKLGVEQPELTVGEVYERTRQLTIELPSGRTTRRSITELVNDVTLTMPQAIILPGGWKLVASLDCEGELPIVSSPYGTEPVIPQRILDAHGECEHCRQSRARRFTVVVENGEGRMMQVGRTCLADFLGHDDFAAESIEGFAPATFILACDEADRDDDFTAEGGWRRGRYLLDNVEVVAYALACTDEWGWTPRSQETETRRATADDVSMMMWGRGGSVFTDVSAAAESDAVKAEAEAALEWAKALAPRSGYESNLQAVALRGSVDPRHFGLLVSLGQAYRRHLETERSRAAEAEVVMVAAPEGRVEVEGKILTAKVKESDFGCTLKLLLLCEGEGGSFKVWVSAPKALCDNERVPGVTVRMTVTLKRSDDPSFAWGSRPAKAVALEVA